MYFNSVWESEYTSVQMADQPWQIETWLTTGVATSVAKQAMASAASLPKRSGHGQGESVIAASLFGVFPSPPLHPLLLTHDQLEDAKYVPQINHIGSPAFH